jgi:hypothetical protein
VPKQQYSNDGVTIAPEKLQTTDDSYPDYWTITILRVLPDASIKRNTGQTAQLKIVEVFSDISLFIDWFNEISFQTNGIQHKAMAHDNLLKNIKLCPHNKPSTLCVHCSNNMQLQAEFIDNVEENTSFAYIRDYASAWRDHSLAYLSESADVVNDKVSKYLEWSRNPLSWTWSEFTLRLWLQLHMLIFWLALQSPIIDMILGRILGYQFTFMAIGKALSHPKIVRYGCRLIGHKISSTLVAPGNLARILVGISGVISLYKLYKYLIPSKLGGDMQGVGSSTGVAPESKNEKVNVWYSDTYECTVDDVTPTILSSCKTDIDTFISRISNNLVHISVKFTDNESVKIRKAKAFCIKGHVYVINNHILPDIYPLELTVTQNNIQEGVNTCFTFMLSKSQIKRCVERDICFVTLMQLPPKKDISEYIPKETYLARFDGLYVSRKQDGQLFTKDVKNLNKIKAVYDYEVIPGSYNGNVWSGAVDVPTKNGDCGSLLISQGARGLCILGMHFLGKDSKVYSIAFDYEFMSKHIPVISKGETGLQYHGAEVDLLHYKSPVRYIQEGTAEVLGSLQGFRSDGKSNVSRTYVCDYMVKHGGYTITTGPPVMNGWQPWRNALKDLVRPVTQIDVDKLTGCAKAFASDIISSLNEQQLKELHVYDDFTAINGKPGLRFIDKINRNTSAGFPYNKSKRSLITYLEPTPEYQHPVAFSDDIMHEVVHIISEYTQGKTCNPVFKAHLKDKPLAFSKIKEAKTRVFCGAPLAWSIVVRKYTLAFIKLLQHNHYLFEAAPGIIAQSTEWDKLYHHLTYFGDDRIVAGDYGKFDKRMPSTVILAAYNIIIDVCKHANWSDEEIKILMCIAEDTAFPLVDFHGDVIRFYGSNPSGHPMTVIINSLANSLYIRYAFDTLKPEDIKIVDFKKYCHLITYGDDMIMNVSSEIPWFNHTTIQSVLNSIDIEFTMADKHSESVPYINISDASFLRRKWVFSDELCAYVCPLDHDSINTMLTMCVASKSVSAQIQALSIIETAMHEYFWYGRERFEERLTFMNEVIKYYDLSVYMTCPLPSWDSLVEQFNSYSNEIGDLGT